MNQQITRNAKAPAVSHWISNAQNRLNGRRFRRSSVTAIIAAACAAMGAAAQGATTVTYFPITGDGDSQISSGKTYTHKLDFGTNTLAVVNGVTFDKMGPGIFPHLDGSTTLPTNHGGNSNQNVTAGSGMANLLQDMLYDNAGGTITLSKLKIGQTYDLRLYNRDWDTAAFNRAQKMDFYTAPGIGSGNLEATIGSINSDDATATPPGLDVVNRAFATSFAFTARTSSAQIKLTQLGAGSYHLYGLTNEVVGPAVTTDFHEIRGRLFNTGVGADGKVLSASTSDPHYTITSVPAGEPFVPGTQALVQQNNGGWIANTAVGQKGSSFISTNASGNNNVAGGNYTTQTTFNLAGWKANTASIIGGVAVDNNLVDVKLNGTSLGISSPTQNVAANFNSFMNFTIPSSGLFQAGNNTLEFVYNNAGNDPGGFRAELQPIAERQATVALPGLFNTGVDNNHNPLPNDANTIDPHYKITVNPDGGSPDAHLENSDAFPLGAGPAWLANSGTAKWIAPKFDTSTSAVGDYTYEVQFDLTGFYANTAELSGSWASDNAGVQILLNGEVVDATNQQFASLSPFVIPVGSNFIDGINTLTFKLNNAGPIPGYTGLRVEGLTGDAVPVEAVPEPTMVSVLMFAGMGMLTRRRARR